MANCKFRWFKLLLWEDNEVHMKVFEFLKSDNNPYQGCYIRHEPEKDEKKPHYHVVLYYPTPRTCEGVSKSFGKCTLVETDNGKKQVYDTTGYDESQILGPIEAIRYITYKDSNGKVQVADNSDMSQISDIRAWGDYLMHNNYECMREGKTRYDLSAIKPFHNDFNFIPKMFELEKVCETGSEVYEIIQFIKDFDCRTFRELIVNLHINSEHTLLRYVESHAYLIKQLL